MVKGDKVKVHTLIEKELYEALWEITKQRFTVPIKKFHIVLNEAIREYIENLGFKLNEPQKQPKEA